MLEKIFYEYAIIRVVPKVEREEFINVGVIIYSKTKKYLKIKIHLNEQRLNAFNHELDINYLQSHLSAMSKVCVGGRMGGPIGALEMPSRFRWLTAVRSSCIQSSKVHGGYTDNLDEELQSLFEEFVL